MKLCFKENIGNYISRIYKVKLIKHIYYFDGQFIGYY